MKYRLIGKICETDFQAASDKLNEGIQQKPPGSVHKHGNIVSLSLSFQIIAIGFQISRHHGDIPVAELSRKRHLLDPDADPSGFLRGTWCLHEADAVPLSRKRPQGIAEQILFQMGKLRVVPKPEKRFVLQIYILRPARSRLLCQPSEILHRLFAQIKQLLLPALRKRILIRCDCHGKNDPFSQLHQSLNQTVLDGSKPGKAVKDHDTSLYNL